MLELDDVLKNIAKMKDLDAKIQTKLASEPNISVRKQEQREYAPLAEIVQILGSTLTEGDYKKFYEEVERDGDQFAERTDRRTEETTARESETTGERSPEV